MKTAEKFTKKPVTIEAIQWKGDNDKECKAFCPTLWFRNGIEMIIPTLEGEMVCKKHSYIIKGIKGEFYPCKPDIFEATYQSAQFSYPDKGEDKWISVEKQKAPEGEPILLYIHNTSTGNRFIETEDPYEYIGSGHLKITHWQPLPTAPKR